MLARIMTARATARGAIVGLAVALVALAGLALASTTGTQQATQHLRDLNKVSDVWGQVFEHVNLEDESMHDYLRAGSDAGRQPLASATGGAAPGLTWLTAHGGATDVANATTAREVYDGFSETLRLLVEAGRRDDRQQLEALASQADLAVASLRKVIAANIARERLETTQYLQEVDDRNHRLRNEAAGAFGAGVVLLALFSMVLLGHQRRVEGQAAETRRHLAELRAAYEREQEAHSARDAMEVELRHAQKLEAVGRLAAGIAHEINTPVQFVSDNLRFLEDSFSELTRVLDGYRRTAGADLQELEGDADVDFLREEVPQALAQSLDGMGRVATIVRSMKAFAHPGQSDPVATDLNQALSDTLVVVSSEVKDVADVRTELGPLPPVVCQIGDLNQVWLNLIVNAAHAIEAAGRGRGQITVRTRQDGDHVVVEVGDTGGGIPPEVAERVFDPFFTTKDVGKGTGQGLPLARTVIVDRHHGTIDFESTPGVGTTFRVRLPVDAGVAADLSAPVPLPGR